MGCLELHLTDFFRFAEAEKIITHEVTDLCFVEQKINAHFEYSPFGKITKTTGSIANRFVFRFSSEYTDTESGLVYYNYRYYSPELGRWLSRDPINEVGSYIFLINNYKLKFFAIEKSKWEMILSKIVSARSARALSMLSLIQAKIASYSNMINSYLLESENNYLFVNNYINTFDVLGLQPPPPTGNGGMGGGSVAPDNQYTGGMGSAAYHSNPEGWVPEPGIDTHGLHLQDPTLPWLGGFLRGLNPFGPLELPPCCNTFSKCVNNCLTVAGGGWIGAGVGLGLSISGGGVPVSVYGIAVWSSCVNVCSRNKCAYP